MTDHTPTDESTRPMTDETDRPMLNGADSEMNRLRIAFVCVQNAGRSQMATAFAERERDVRGLDVEIVSGGTHPADHVHDVVVEVMADVGIDIANRVPTEISRTELEQCTVVATMGCSTLDLDDQEMDVDVQDWALADPHGADRQTACEIRDDVARRVFRLFDKLEDSSSFSPET